MESFFSASAALALHGYAQAFPGGEWGPPSGCSAQASHCGGFSGC